MAEWRRLHLLGRILAATLAVLLQLRVWEALILDSSCERGLKTNDMIEVNKFRQKGVKHYLDSIRFRTENRVNEV